MPDSFSQTGQNTRPNIHSQNGRLYAFFVDFRKFFDTVIHVGITLTLLKGNTGTKIIKSMYSKSKSCVRVDDLVTNFFKTSVGVKQGDYLNPTLFKLFINTYLRFFQRVWWSTGLRKIFQDVLCPTHLFQWKLTCTFNQHCTCLSYKISYRLQFISSLFPQKLFKMLLHWHTFFNMFHTLKTRLNT